MQDERGGMLGRVSFCAGLPGTAVAALAAVGAVARYGAGATIQLEGDPATAMYVVGEGRVKIARLSVGGREQVLYVVGPGGHFNTVPVFDGGPCPANAEALDDALLLVLPAEGVRRVAAEHPALALALLREMTGRLRHLVNLVDDLALHTVQGRLAGLLLAQARAAEAGEAVGPLTQAEIAARLGTVREMVGRCLKGLEAGGALRLERGVITIVDREALARMAEE